MGTDNSKMCAGSDGLWVDSDFPPTNSSIGSDRDSFDDVQWVRGRNINGVSDLFADVAPCDVDQGQLGDCWLLSSMASLAEHPDAVKGIFQQQTISDDGRYTLQLYNQDLSGAQIDVDESIPCDDSGAPLFSRPFNNEMWSLLLEKAMAKLFGDYSSLDGNWMSVAFKAFTGANAAEYGTQDTDDLFQFLYQSDQKNHLMAAGTQQDWNGLVGGHAYSLLQVVSIDNFQLLMMRNPWGQVEWQGAWSDGDAMWDQNPDVKQQLRPVFQDDGIFWMCFDDFCRGFPVVTVCEKVMRTGSAAHQKKHNPGKYWTHVYRNRHHPKQHDRPKHHQMRRYNGQPYKKPKRHENGKHAHQHGNQQRPNGAAHAQQRERVRHGIKPVKDAAHSSHPEHGKAAHPHSNHRSRSPKRHGHHHGGHGCHAHRGA